jgi:hypothetical protein
LIALIACVANASGTLTLDAALFVPISCQSGDRENLAFVGADLADAAGNKLRSNSPRMRSIAPRGSTP